MGAIYQMQGASPFWRHQRMEAYGIQATRAAGHRATEAPLRLRDAGIN